MLPAAPAELLARAREWDHLSRWERSELGRSLRRRGWTYGEIMEVLPVPKGTLAGWCRDIRMSESQVAAIKERRPPGVRTGIPVDTQRRRRLEVQAIRQSAIVEAGELRHDAYWMAGTVMYWAEGGKTKRSLALANTDPSALTLFMGWVRCYLIEQPSFVLALHLHEGNNEAAAKAHWSAELRLADPEYHKTFIKPRGTGHRTNRLPHGVCRVTVRRSADAWLRAMAWIDSLSSLLSERTVDPGC